MGSYTIKCLRLFFSAYIYTYMVMKKSFEIKMGDGRKLGTDRQKDRHKYACTCMNPHMHAHTHTHTEYRNPRCTRAPRFNNYNY